MEKLTFKRCQDFLEVFLARLKERIGTDLLSVALYGSIARDQGGPTSDMDILIIHEGDREAIFHYFVQILLEIRQSPPYLKLREEGFSPDLCPVFLNRKQLAGHPWILLDIMDHGIVLYDREEILQKELDQLKKRTQALGSRKVVRSDGSWYWDLKPDWKPGEIIDL